MPQLPVILTTFAQSPSGTYLAALGEEQKQIQAALQPAADSGAIQFAEQAGSRNEDIPQLLAKYPNQVSIFHFGGHADSDSLAAEDGSIFVEGLADQLAIQAQLKLVFLNGCQTQAQVQHFFRQGIPLVLATTCSIADGEASYFAAQFYSAIAGRHSIREAFQLAVGALKAKYDQYRGVELPAYRTVRGVRLREQQLSQVPWQLYVQEGREEVLEWQLSYPRGLTRLPSLHLETDCLGRETELETLQTLLHESSKVVLVSGLGGMGKTTLAAGYLQWLRNDYDYIAWINSGDDLMSSFALNADLAKNLELPFVENEKIDDRFARLMNKLRNQPGRNLLVIDDVGDQVSEIAGQLPSGANWQVLVTSRLPLPDFREMKLGVLQANDALRLFRLYFQEGTDEEVQDLLIEINYHTLTIEVMAKTLNRLNGLLTVPELLVILRERKLYDPRLQELVWTRHAGEERAIFFHLMKAFELAKLSEEEIWLMQQYAVLPAIPIEVKTLADLLQQEPLSLNRQVNGLNDKGWIGKLGKGLGMHRVVQEVVKYKKAPRGEEIEALLDSLCEKMKKEDYGNPVTDNFPWLIYAEKVAAYFSEYENLPGKVSVLWNNLATVLGDSGNYSIAAQLLERTLDNELRNFGEAYPTVATTRSNLANILGHLGNYTRAAQLLEQALDSDLRNFGEAHPSVARSQSNLALILIDLGDYTRATQLLEQALNSDLRNFDENHPLLAKKKSNLAVMYQGLGDYTRAAQLLEQALDSNLRNFGKDHPGVVITQSNLALVYKDLGNYARAAQLLEQAVENAMRNFGEDHPTVTMSQSNLALVYQDLGDYTRAAQLLEKALNNTLSNYDQDHPEVMRRQSNLALVYQDLGDYTHAVQLLEQALDSAMHNFGKDHPYTAICQSNLALVYRALGEYARAAQLLEQALDSAILNFGENHPSVAKSQSNLATVLRDLGDYTRAAQLLEKALDSAILNLGQDHPTVTVRLSNLALVYSALGEHARAAQLLEQALDSAIHNFGENHPSVAKSQSNLATVLGNLGDYSRAAQLLEKALDSAIRNLGQDHPTVAFRQWNLATIYYYLDQLSETKLLLEQALKTVEKSLGQNHPHYAGIMSWLEEVNKNLNASN